MNAIEVRLSLPFSTLEENSVRVVIRHQEVSTGLDLLSLMPSLVG